MIPNATECCFYRIREGTKDEYVAVGFDGDVIRWGPTGGKEQEWLILPLNNQHCRIMSRQNGDFMAVGFGGDIIRWGETGKVD